jgi:hypothetical protein
MLPPLPPTSQLMTQERLDKIRAFLKRIRNLVQPCKYGHRHCSDVRGGACSDEGLKSLKTVA